MKEQNVPVVDVDWRPPKEGIRHLRVTKTGISIDEANDRVVEIIKKPARCWWAWAWPSIPSRVTNPT